jgi:hypothetical protein
MAGPFRLPRAVLAVVVGTALIGCVSVTALAGPPPAAGASADCSSGVIVAVDMSPWQNTIDTVCDSDLPQNAVDALQISGFDPAGTAQYGLAFICRIAGDPPPSEQSCEDTPPATAYWSFWIADAGANAWSYSNVGAASLQPQAGSVEAWVFGGLRASTPPDIPSPDQIRASTTDTVGSGGQPPPTTNPTSTTAVDSSGTVPGTTSTPGSSGGTGSGGVTGTGTSKPGSSSSPATSGSSPGHPSGGTETDSPSSKSPSSSSHGNPGGDGGAASGKGSSTPRIVSAAPALAHASSGTPVGVVIGAVAVIALLGAAGLITWRRRRSAG